jgi:hypothetical protein
MIRKTDKPVENKPKKSDKFRVRRRTVTESNPYDYTVERDISDPEDDSYYVNTCTHIHSEPTGNCQLCCACDMREVLKRIDSQDEFNRLMKDIYVNVSKPLMLVDLKKYTDVGRECHCDGEEECICEREPESDPCEQYDKFVEYTKDILVSNQDYISSNDSDMTIFIINIGKLKPKSLLSDN